MTRAKKEKLLLEELLEKALLKEEEHPYDLPSNWVWTQLTNLSRCISKGTTPKGGKDAYKDRGVAFLRVENINTIGKIDLENIKFIEEEIHLGCLKRSILEQDDILVSIAGTLGRTAIVDKEVLPLNTNQAIAFIRLQNKEKISSKYVEKLISSPAIQEKLLRQTKVTSIPNLTLEIISNCPIPLPPLAEQQRIVERIESLFEKLDTAKEIAQNVLDSFKNRKAAILHKAFTGELTAKWREENGVSLDSWEEKKLGELIKTGPQNGLYKAQSAYGQGERIVRIDNFYDGHINDWDTLKKLELTEGEKELYSLNNNDVIINRVNSIQYLGKSALVRNLDGICVFESNIMRLSLESSAYPEYVIKYLNSEIGLTELRKNAKHAVNQASINQTDVKNAFIMLPKIHEQEEIVRILDNILGNEQQAQELCDVIEKIDLMKKAILARAFRGELGTNNPEEESAIELLKEVLKEKL